MDRTKAIITECVKHSTSRLDLWVRFLNDTEVNNLVELGVYKGDFSEKILKNCESIKKYYMIDPWRHLDDWNKPANVTDDIFERLLSETISKTNFAAEKRIILRGKTTEVIREIPDDELEFAYIDGDHTLRGIAIDLILLFPKVRNGGWLAGDDFSNNIFQHAIIFEPTLVFPFAVYFAEAVGARIYALPYLQFLIEKNIEQSFAFIDLTNSYEDTSLRYQFRPDKIPKLKLKEKFSFIWKFAWRAKRYCQNRNYFK